ncbi:hypothetical protein A7X67_02935 [Clostridium sp. W14A]|nr:hypothetical protein A7X67_02935 [Clostridium sp. W14A]
MYRQECFEQLKLDLPFGIALNKKNHWVKLAGYFHGAKRPMNEENAEEPIPESSNRGTAY